MTRILRVKLRAGLFDKGPPSSRLLANKSAGIGAPEHRAIAREAVRESLVLLKNQGNLLPLRPHLSVMVSGDGADNLGKQTGGWSLTWQGTGNTREDFPGATSIYEGIRTAVTAAGGAAILSPDGSYASKPDVAIVVFGEDPYAEWHGDIRSLNYRAADFRNEIDPSRPPPESPAPGSWSEPRIDTSAPVLPEPDLALLTRLQHSHIPVVAVFITGRPRGITPELDASDAFVVAWLPGTEGNGIADVLFRKTTGEANFDFIGKLSFEWPREAPLAGLNTKLDDSPLFPLGFGLTYCNRNCDARSSKKLWQTPPSSMSRSTPGFR